MLWRLYSVWPDACMLCRYHIREINVKPDKTSMLWPAITVWAEDYETCDHMRVYFVVLTYLINYVVSLGFFACFLILIWFFYNYYYFLYFIIPFGKFGQRLRWCDQMLTKPVTRCVCVCVFPFRQDGMWDTEKVIDVPAKTVEGWTQPDMPSECSATRYPSCGGTRGKKCDTFSHERARPDYK